MANMDGEYSRCAVDVVFTRLDCNGMCALREATNTNDRMGEVEGGEKKLNACTLLQTINCNFTPFASVMCRFFLCALVERALFFVCRRADDGGFLLARSTSPQLHEYVRSECSVCFTRMILRIPECTSELPSQKKCKICQHICASSVDGPEKSRKCTAARAWLWLPDGEW